LSHVQLINASLRLEIPQINGNLPNYGLSVY